MFDEAAKVDGQRARRMNYDRKRNPPALFVLDPRPYNSHRGRLLHADRVFVGSVWTPLVRVRARLPRASEGSTENCSPVWVSQRPSRTAPTKRSAAAYGSISPATTWPAN